MPDPKNKKFIALKEKENRQKRFILIGTVSILVIVIALVAFGLLQENVFAPKKTIIELGSQSMNATEFKQRVSYQRLNMVSQAIQMYQYGMQDYVTQFAIQLQQPELVGQIVLDDIKAEMVIMAEAEKLGIELSDDEIEIETQKLFGYFADGTPTPVPTQEILPTSTLTEQQLTLVPDTATPTATATPEEGEEVEVEEEELPTPTPTATQEAAEEEVEDNSTPDPTATPILKPTEFTYELYQARYQETLDGLATEAQMDEETLKGIILAYIYREKVMEAVITDVEESQDFVWARHILLEDEETAKEVLAMLNDGGDFTELAKEYSTGPSAEDGGDLGWFAEDTMVEPFSVAAFSLEIGEISEPVETSFGWHIIQVLGKEERPLDQRTLEQKRQAAFDDWLAEKMAEYESEFVISETWTEDLPTEPSLPPELLQLLNQPQQAPSVGDDQ